MKQTPSPVKRLWELTGTHRRAYMLSIILAILSVACGMIPYFAIAYIMLCLIDGVTALNTYALWCGVILLGFTLKLFFRFSRARLLLCGHWAWIFGLLPGN